MPFLDEDGVTRLTEDYLDIFAPKEELGEGDGTNAGPIYELSAKGHAEQFSTTGKNLLPNKAINRTYNGVTFTINSDGSINVNGTASDNSSYVMIQSGLVNFSTSGTYHISGPSVSTAIQGAYMSFRVDSDSWMSIRNSDGANVSIDAGSHNIIASIVVDSGTTVSNYTVYPQLELGSEATEYEPYTGGAPSPSPDYPQEIQVVRGRNLIDESTATVGKRVKSDTGKLQDSSFTNVSDFIKVEPNTDYYLANSIGDQSGYTGAVFDSNKECLRAITFHGSGVQSNTFNTGADAAYVRVNYFNETESRYAGPPMLTLGSGPQPYVPYGHVGMEAQGKNLFDKSTAEVDKYVDDANGRLVFNNTTGSFASDYIPVVSGVTYSITNTGKSMWGAWYDSSKRYISGLLYYDRLHTAPSNASYLRLTVLKSYIDTFQVEASDHATEYEPYYHTTTPIPLPDRGWVGGLPDGTSDILTLDGAGKCEWEMATNEIVLDGTQNIVDVFVGTNNNGCRFAWFITDHKKGDGTQSNLFISHAQYSIDVMSQFTWRVGQFFSWTNPSSVKQLFITLSQTTANEANTWLSTHPITVLYPLATPVTEDMGYIEDWPTDIPTGATITIPELDALNVKYFVTNDSISQYAEQWYERTKVVEIDPVEDAIGDLTSVVANLVTHDQFYFGYDEVNGKKMISIFKRGDI